MDVNGIQNVIIMFMTRATSKAGITLIILAMQAVYCCNACTADPGLLVCEEFCMFSPCTHRFPLLSPGSEATGPPDQDNNSFEQCVNTFMKPDRETIMLKTDGDILH